MTAKGYGELIVKRKWLALLAGLLFTVFWIGGLSGLSMNPDNRITKRSKTTYWVWAEKEGFLWLDFRKDWITHYKEMRCKLKT